jgi:hypothetical protein
MGVERAGISLFVLVMGCPARGLRVKSTNRNTRHRDSSADTAAGLRNRLHRNRGMIPGKGNTFLFSKGSGPIPSHTQFPVRRTSVIYPWAVKLTSHIRLAPRLGMHGCTPPFLHMLSRGGSLLNTGTNLTYKNTFSTR